MSEVETLKLLKRLRWMARFMDAGWGIPFTRLRFGADAFAGFVPVGGDAIMVLASLRLIIETPRSRRSRSVSRTTSGTNGCFAQHQPTSGKTSEITADTWLGWASN